MSTHGSNKKKAKCKGKDKKIKYIRLMRYKARRSGSISSMSSCVILKRVRANELN